MTEGAAADGVSLRPGGTGGLSLRPGAAGLSLRPGGAGLGGPGGGFASFAMGSRPQVTRGPLTLEPLRQITRPFFPLSTHIITGGAKLAF